MPKPFLTFPEGFWISIIFSNLNLNCCNVVVMYSWATPLEKLKKHSVSKIVLTFLCLNKFFEWSHFFLQILSLQQRISKVFSRSLEQLVRTILEAKYHCPVILIRKISEKEFRHICAHKILLHMHFIFEHRAKGWKPSGFFFHMFLPSTQEIERVIWFVLLCDLKIES
jgi:hypothetical protein